MGSMTWYDTGLPADDADPMSVVEVEGVRVCVVFADGRWWAVEDRCSHAGCAFSADGELEGTVLICGCHGSEFDIRTGAALQPPAIDPIDCFATRVSWGTIEIEI